MKLELRHLAAFYVLAQELHFGRAAARLHLSPPPLSKHIKQLEEIAGVALFTRTTRAVKLTPAGAIMHAELQEIFNRLEGMLRSVRDASQSNGGRLAIGLTPTAASTPVIGALLKYRTLHPDVQLDLQEMNSVEMEDALKLLRIDVALMRPCAVSPDVVLTTVHKEPICAAMRKESALLYGTISADQLLDHPLIAYEKKVSPYFGSLIERMFSNAGKKPAYIQESRLPTILTLVEAGVGIALVPASIIKTRQNILVGVPLDNTTSVMAELAIARLKTNQNALVQNFIGTLLTYSGFVE